MPHTALIAGGTGLVGRALLSRLAATQDFTETTALVRKPAGLASVRVVEQVVDFRQLAAAHLPSADTVFCTLGTTIKVAGSQAAFREVDFDYVVQLGSLARAAGAQHFLVVSAVGVSPDSRIFYNRVKGEMEVALQGQGWPRLSIFRPSLLLGERAETRLGEQLAAKFGWLMPAKFRPIAATDVAQAMLRIAAQAGSGLRIIESAEIHTLARRAS